MELYGTVTESQLILLATRQASQWRDEMFGQGIMTLSRKPPDQEDDRLVSQSPILPKFGFRLLY